MTEAESKRELAYSLVEFTTKRRFPTTEALSAARLGAVDIPLAFDAFNSAQTDLEVYLM